MAILIFQHHPLEGPERLGAILRGYGHRLRVCELYEDPTLPPDLDGIDGVVSLGGPMNVDQADEHAWMAGEMQMLREAHEHKIPVVGICLGAQLVAKALGGEVSAMEQPEVGFEPVQLAFPGTIDPVHNGIPWRTWQFHMHGQEVTTLPGDGTPLSGSKACRTQAYKVGLTTYCFQYHFEWTRQTIDAVLEKNSAMVEQTGKSDEEIRAAIDAHYEMFRHLDDRLCHNIAALLMPIDKRFGARHAPAEPNPLKNWQPAKS
ncbi:MAG: type 1 glutamine amidotransferase [Phycisphaeraceae bacterium]